MIRLLVQSALCCGLILSLPGANTLFVAAAEVRATSPLPGPDEVGILEAKALAAIERGQQEKAARLFQEAAAQAHHQAVVANKPKARQSLIWNTMNLWGRSNAAVFERSIQLRWRAFEAFQAAGKPQKAVKTLIQGATFCGSSGRTSDGLAFARRAADLAREIKQPALEVAALQGMGNLCAWQQKPKDALPYYESALTVCEVNGLRRETLTLLLTYGGVLNAAGQYQKAVAILSRACLEAEALGDKRLAAGARQFKAVSQAMAGRTNESVDSFLHAAQDETTGVAPYHLARAGVMTIRSGRVEEGLSLLREAMRRAQAVNSSHLRMSVATLWGAELVALGRYQEALPIVEEAVRLTDEVVERMPLTGWREMRDSWFAPYHYLILARASSKDAEQAFMAFEATRAKVLAALLERPTPRGGSWESIRTYLGDERALLGYHALGWRNGYQFTPEGRAWRQGAKMVVTSKSALALTLDGSALVSRSGPASVAARPARSLRGARPVDFSTGQRKHEVAPSSPDGPGIEDVVQAFRRALEQSGNEGKGDAESLGRLLYEELVAPFEAQLAGKKALIIVPAGPLALLPFEALIDRRGRYLAESWDIWYAPSVSVLLTLEARKYPAKRASVLAVGDPVYAAGSWASLPGARAELAKIAKALPGTRLYTRQEATEARLKSLSKNGELAKYRFVHFATHGRAARDRATEAALVFAEAETRGKEDGYLSVAEVLDLRLAADVVALSACESGIGTNSAGEGMVGLTQCFLLAGANAVSATLWPVADASSARFMGAVYEQVAAGSSFPAALAQVRRRFIRGEFGDAERMPFHWAPHVFYGVSAAGIGGKSR